MPPPNGEWQVLEKLTEKYPYIHFFKNIINHKVDPRNIYWILSVSHFHMQSMRKSLQVWGKNTF